jgi:MFS family permease
MIMSTEFWKLLSGHTFSTTGNCFYNVSLIWIIYHLTGNTFYTGLTGFLVLMPMMMQFLVGPLIEKFNKKKLLILTEAGQIITVITAFSLYNTIWHNVWALIFLTPIVAILSMFSNPAEMTLIPSFVNEEKYSAANSLMNVTYQTLSIISTSVVGVLLGFLNPLTLYIFSAVFNLCGAICFFTIHLKTGENMKEDLPEKTGLLYELRIYRQSLIKGLNIVRSSFISSFIPATIIANLVLGMLNAVLPAYASDRGGSQWYGFYQSAETIGILVGSALAPALKNIPLGKLTINCFFFSSVAWIYSYFTANNTLSLILYAASLVAIGVTNILFVSAMQKAVPQEHLAQIYTILISFGGCAMPLGSLSGGQIAHLFGNTPIFLSVGVAFLFVSICWLSSKILRQIPATEHVGCGNYTIYPEKHGESFYQHD